MNQYILFEASDGRRRLPVDIALPHQIIEARTIQDAINVFALHRNFEPVHSDVLAEEDVCVRFRKRNTYGDSPEYTYYIRLLTKEEELDTR